MEIRITKELLHDYKRMKHEIPVLEKELEEMLAADAAKNGIICPALSAKTMERRPILQSSLTLYEERKKILEIEKSKVEAVERWIDSIEDGRTRCVFRMFYIEGLKWMKVAHKTGYGRNADYPRLMIRDRYLKDNHLV